MKRQARKGSLIFLALFLGLLATDDQARAAGEIDLNYMKLPAFLEVGLNPNLLLLIDNSASMYDPAYRNAEGANYCYVRAWEDLDGDGVLDTDLLGNGGATNSDTEDSNGNGVLDVNYDSAVSHAGYFDPDPSKWYVHYLPGRPETAGWGYEEFVQKTAATAKAWCTGKGGTIYSNSELCLTIDNTTTPKKVIAFAAKGNFLNWLLASKFDVEKEVLTGGKYDSWHAQMVLESRGCDGKRFLKEVPVSSGGTNYVASFGVRPPTDAEKNSPGLHHPGDLAYNGSISNTRLDFFKVLPIGMQFKACADAIAAYDAGNLGQMATATKACLDPMNTGLYASGTAFNHILQECWYYNKFGNWQPGGGTVSSLMNDCTNVYKYPASYTNPSTLNPVDVCNGQYSPTADHTTTWGSGYIGQCWEETFGVPVIPAPCPAGSPVTKATAVKDANGYWYYCNAGLYTRCGNNALPSCKVSDWAVWYIPDPAGATTLPIAAGWTNDNPLQDVNPKPQGYTCVDAALKSYCRQLEEQTTIDPSDYADSQGITWGLPALLVDAASQSQLGAPLGSGIARIFTPAPTGLIQEFKYNLRMGAMQFNVGTQAECKPIQQPPGSGRWIASLYDCLLDKGSAINAASLPDPAKLNGGKIISYIDEGSTHNANLVRSINNIQANAWTPTGEALFNALGYYTQDNVNNLRLNTSDFIWDHDAAGLGVANWSNATFYAPNAKVKYTQNKGGLPETKLYFTYDGGISHSTTGNIKDDDGVRWTPYDPVLASCQTNNILIITDGASTADYDGLAGRVTSFVTNHHDTDMAPTWEAGASETASYECKARDANNNVISNLYGSTMMDDLAYYGNKNGADIYQGTYRTIDGEDKQGINVHLVAAGTLPVPVDPSLECEPKTLLTNTAANSGTQLHEANAPAALEDSLRDIFESIGGEPASGSAASVISNSRSGEGAIYQAVFYPKQIDAALREITWAGDVHSLWLDDQGNIREDCGASDCTTQDFKLDLKKDNILQFYTDANSSARARRFSDADGNSSYDSGDFLEDNIKLNELRYIWSAGEWLAAASPAQKATYDSTNKERYIFTSANGSTKIPFTAAALADSLGAAYPGYFKAASPAEADNIVNYIRGNDIWPYRSRLIDWDGNGTPEVWKLGDIVHSTPTVVSQPAEDYDLIYQDKSYLAFRQKYRDRRTMIYAGGNDGGLHAFNGGYYDRANRTFLKGPAGKSQYDLGAEMWMFVPKNIWPHLQWLTKPKYEHIFFVDLKPYIFDAKIFAPDADHPHGWGTVMVAGMRFGGGNIGVDLDANGTDDQTMRSSYFLLDITNPEAPPALLAEFTRPDLGMTVGAPSAIPMLRCTLKVDCPDDMPMDWYLAFPSGPHGPAGDTTIPLKALQGTSDQAARLFIYPLGGTAAAGGLGHVGGFVPAVQTKSFTPADAATFSSSYFSDIITVDYDLDFKSDTLYFGSVAHANNDDHRLHTGGVHRLKISADLDPANWQLTTFFKTPGNQAVTAAPSVAWDGKRAWVYVGTGSYYSAKQDKVVLAQQSFYGLKERYDGAEQMLLDQPNGGNLVDVSDVWVKNILGTLSEPLKSTGTTGPPAIASGTLNATTFKELDREMSETYYEGVDLLDKYHGWKLDFDLLGERNLGQAAILGNIVTFTTYVPSTDICKPEGNSYLWAPYYRTGTAYFRSIIGVDQPTQEVLRKELIGVGLATTPNIHSGGEEGTKAFVQTSTGAIISIEQDNPGVVKSGMQSWRELTNSSCGK